MSDPIPVVSSLASKAPDASYRRELAAARRDAVELCELLLNPDNRPICALTEKRDPSLRELMTALGLATMARDALLRAAKARAEKPDAAG